MRRKLLKIGTEGVGMFSAFCKRVVARFGSRCGDSAARDQNDRVQEQPHLVSSSDEGVDFVVRHGFPPFRFEHLSLAFEGSEQPLLRLGFWCHSTVMQSNTDGLTHRELPRHLWCVCLAE